MEAALQNDSPVIISIAEVHLPFVTLEHICPSILKMADRYDVPVTLNFGHGMTEDAINRAIDNGFTSIMYNGSKLDFKDNVNETRKVVELCKPYNNSVKAELGAEGGELIGGVNPANYTDIEEASQFVVQTGIDTLAVAIGNSHGAYKGTPQLDFELLEGGYGITVHGDTVFVPSYTVDRTQIMGTVGAGDAFCAGVLYGLHQDFGLKKSIQFGNATARFSLLDQTSTGGVEDAATILGFMETALQNNDMF